MLCVCGGGGGGRHRYVKEENKKYLNSVYCNSMLSCGLLKTWLQILWNFTHWEVGSMSPPLKSGWACVSTNKTWLRWPYVTSQARFKKGMPLLPGSWMIFLETFPQLPSGEKSRTHGEVTWMCSGWLSQLSPAFESSQPRPQTLRRRKQAILVVPCPNLYPQDLWTQSSSYFKPLCWGCF